MKTKGKSAGSSMETQGSSRNDSQQTQPILDQPGQGQERQAFGTLVHRPLGLDEQACQESVEALNQILADTLTLRDMYKKHHWHTTGPTFYMLHKLFDKHWAQQVELADELAERVQLLGGVSVAMGADVAEMTQIARPPRGREDPPAQIARLLQAHETILKNAREAADQASQSGDDGTNDLLVSDVIRTNEMQVWFLSEHLVAAPIVHSHTEE